MRVEVRQQHSLAARLGNARQQPAGVRLAHAALEVEDRDDAGRRSASNHRHERTIALGAASSAAASGSAYLVKKKGQTRDFGYAYFAKSYSRGDRAELVRRFPLSKNSNAWGPT